MAYDWDKLCQAQNNYPKPKFALDVIGKQLKKRPNDPYVLAWKSSIILSQDGDAGSVLTTLKSLGQHQPPIIDFPFLSYIYELTAKALRQSDSMLLLSLPTVGNHGRPLWENAAKALSSRSARLQLWSELFAIAMREACWEDARFATVQAIKESPASKKTTYYSLIFANQMAAGQAAGNADPKTKMSSKIQYSVALQKMRDAFEGSERLPDQSVRVSNMRDLRFMAEVYADQNRAVELVRLWGDRPQELQKVWRDHRLDIDLLLAETLQKTGSWEGLAKFGEDFIRQELGQSPERVKHICSVAYSILNGFVEASEKFYPPEEAANRMLPVYELFEKSASGSDSRDREIQLIRLMLALFAKQPLLPLLKDFWVDNFRRRSCFFDLQRIVVQLVPSEIKEFYDFINGMARSKKPKESSQGDSESWLLAELSVLQFEHLIFIVTKDKPKIEMVSAHAVNCLKLYKIATQMDNDAAFDIACIAVASLVKLFWNTEESGYWLPALLQAAMLLRNILSSEKGRSSRQLALISTRVHLLLGLGTIAFEHYGYAKVKEMLHDSCAWILLSLISKTHPYDVKGPRGFSADDELAKVIASIQKMENRVDDFLFKDLQDFGFDTAFDLLRLRFKTKCSLTKHSCLIERRRIARLKGQTIDSQLDIHVSDISADPNLDCYKLEGLSNFDFLGDQYNVKLFGLRLPQRLWVVNSCFTWEIPNRIIYKEPLPDSYLQAIDYHYGLEYEKLAKRLGNEGLGGKMFVLRGECGMDKCFAHLGNITTKIFKVSVKRFDLCSIGDSLREIIRTIEVWITTVKTGIEQTRRENPFENRYLTEYLLMESYIRLEVLQAIARLSPTLKEILRQKSHPWHGVLPKPLVEKLLKLTEDCYEAIMSLARADIERLKKSGTATTRAFVRIGRTGEALQTILSDDEINAYTKEYTDSAIEACNGILNVKLN